MELEKIIEYIVQEVIKKINSQNLIEDCSPKEKILVAINGSTNNLEQVILELKRISKNHDLSLVFSEAASNIIDENLFEKDEEKVIYTLIIELEKTRDIEFEAHTEKLLNSANVINNYFDKVIINAENIKIKNNRIATLQKLNSLCKEILSI